MTPPLSDHFNGKTFFSRGHINRNWLDVLRWRLTSRGARWPARVELTPQSPPPAPRGDEIVATWIGHATWLVRTTHGNFLFDPVFSERASPVQWAGPRRVHPPGLAFEKLPKIDTVFLSHDHYDHCDAPTLRRLAREHAPLFITPLRNGELLAAVGAQRIVELDWWQTHAVAAGVQVALTPARHWSNRLGAPRNHRLWGGFMVEFSILDSRFSTASESGGAPAARPIENRESKIENPGARRRLWFAGDTGYDAKLFGEIRTRCGAPDLALIPIGAYEPRWFMAPMHINPAEAVTVHREVGAKLSLAMHWGAFQLTDEAREAPVEALVTARAAAGVSADAFRAIEPGASIVV